MPHPGSAAPRPARPGDREALQLWQVVSIGVGGMVGGGIFAVLGLSVELTGGAAPIAFALAGAVAGLTAWSYAALAVRYPDRGGTVTFINHAYGGGVLAGGLNVLLWLSYIVMLALYASAFGNYFVALLPGQPAPWVGKVALVAVMAALTSLNAASAAAVGRFEEWIVVGKVAILLVFVVAGLTAVDPGRLAPSTWSGPLSIVGGGMLIFVAYEGFELIANAAEDTRDPRRTLPRAFAISVVGVGALYVLIAAVTVGVLTLPQIRSAEDFALAEAARPRFGRVGFTVIALAALLSTASAINATLYGSTRLTYSIARSGELPAPFGRTLRGGLGGGLLATSVLTAILAVMLDLGRISTMGSAGFLVIFAAVNLARVRLRVGGRRARWGLAGFAGCILALAALVIEVGRNDPMAATVAGLLLGGAFVAEMIYRAFTGRVISHRFRGSPVDADGRG